MKLFKNFISTCLFLGYFLLSHAQNPILLEDFITGRKAISLGYYNSLQLGDVIFFVGGEPGFRNLYAIKDDKIRHIDSLCTVCDYNPFLFEYKDKLYYQKEVINSVTQLRCTDGSAENNELVFENNGGFSSINIGNNNKIYIGSGINIYLSDGTKDGTKLINNGLSLGTDLFFEGKPVKYGNGIAFFNIRRDTLKIYNFNEDSLIQLGSKNVSRSTLPRGLNSINNDDLIIVTNNNTNELTEVLRFEKATGEISKEFELKPPYFGRPYLLPFSKDTLILYYINGGHHAITGKPLEKINLTPYSTVSNGLYLRQFYQYNGKLVYVTSQNDVPIETTSVILFDGNINNIKEFGAAQRYPILSAHKQYVFLSYNDSFGEEGEISVLNMDTEEYTTLLSLNQDFSSGGVQTLGMIGNKIYFLARFDFDIGREVYYIESDHISSTNETISESSPSFELVQRGRKYWIKDVFNDNNNYTLEIFDTSGRQIYTSLISSDIEYNFMDKITGLVMVRVRDNSSYLAKSYPIFLH